MIGFVIEDVEVERYKQQLEEHLSSHMDIIESEGMRLVRCAYIPNSVNLEYFEPSEDPLTSYWTEWSYKFVQSEVEIGGQHTELSFYPPIELEGYIALPVDAYGSLQYEDADFLHGIEGAIEI